MHKLGYLIHCTVNLYTTNLPISYILILIAVYCQLSKVYAIACFLVQFEINSHSLVLLIPNYTRNHYTNTDKNHLLGKSTLNNCERIQYPGMSTLWNQKFIYSSHVGALEKSERMSHQKRSGFQTCATLKMYAAFFIAWATFSFSAHKLYS